MRRATRPAALPANRSAGRLVVLALLVASGPACQASAPPAGPALPATLEGYRADAWFLPDDPLLGFVEIPAGPFVMGSDPAVDPQAYDNERWSPSDAQGTVDLPAFYIGRTEVTVAQFGAYAAAAGASVAGEALRGPPDHPVANISWPDALAYARWLETTLRGWSGTPPALRQRLDQGWRITLPTEAQWEKAARGTDGRVFPWGDTPRPGAANDNTGPGATVAVGPIDCPDCAHGLSDTAGNVWELTRSPYQPYPYTDADDADDLSGDALFIMRGGSFTDPPANTRAAVRGGADPGARRPFIGFRIVLTVD
ncbi:MAG: formylglycine-generating enzyme family protein [Acidobacteria bacterium]|nr:formylglycine-generating enzyme family protein [Acidobacteriota bacterium]